MREEGEIEKAACSAGAVWRERESGHMRAVSGAYKRAAVRYCAMILSHYRLIKNKSKSLLRVAAEKWLKRTYIMNGREREGEKRGGRAEDRERLAFLR